MASYKVLKIIETKKLEKRKLVIDGYAMNPKLKSKSELIEVNKIIISNDELQKKTISRQFNVAYRRLFALVMDNIESTDATETDTKIVLGEVTKMKRVLEEKYKQKIDKKNYQVMLRKIEMLENNIKQKLLIEQNIRKMLQNMTLEESEREKGRGR